MRKVNAFFCVIFTAFVSSIACAKDIDMYDQPVATAKVVSKVDTAAGIIPIFTPKDSGWVKVADPHNGNVGWVKTSDLNGTNVSVTRQQIMISPQQQQPQQPTTVVDMLAAPIGSTNQPPPRPMTKAETQQMLQNLEMQKQEVQQSTQQLMQATMRYLNAMFQEQARLLSGQNVIYPAPQNGTQPTNAKGQMPPPPQSQQPAKAP